MGRLRPSQKNTRRDDKQNTCPPAFRTAGVSEIYETREARVGKLDVLVAELLVVLQLRGVAEASEKDRSLAEAVARGILETSDARLGVRQHSRVGR